MVSNTTGSSYWTLIGVAGVALLVTTLVHRVGRAGPAILGVAVALTVAGGFFAAYSAVGSAGTNL